MKRLITKKSLSIFTAIVLILALTVTAFAAWPSFQNTNFNDGVIDPTSPPPITTPTANTVALPTNGTIGTTVFSGVDSTSVIDDNVSYTLYNGGDYNVSNTSGGARIAAVDLTAPGTAPNWTYSLDARAGNTQQLSAPYLDTTSSGTLYAATTYYTNELATSTLAGWIGSTTGEQVASPLEIAAGASISIYYAGLIVPSDFWQPQLATDINFTPTSSSSTTADVTLIPRNGGVSIDFGTAYYYSGNWTMYNSSNTMVPAGQYDIELEITVPSDETATVSLSSISFLTARWSVYALTGFNVSTPPTGRSMLATGYGQANTPISYYTTTNEDSYIYLGIYEGDRSYYQIDTSSYAVTQFKPTVGTTVGDDFYGAGAAPALAREEYIVFGSDSGTLYAQPPGAKFGTASAGIPYTLSPTPGKIRSSINTIDGRTNGYFTSTTSGTAGYVWQFDPLTVGATPLTYTGVILPTAAGTSTSTPVQSSNNDYVYFGTYNSFTSGTVLAIPVNNFVAAAIVTIYSGDPVQSSPIVYTDLDDYIYFTTNSYSGAGYCYSYGGSGTTPTQEWTYANTSSNPFSVQGMASDGGYVVWGDDGNNLYIA